MICNKDIAKKTAKQLLAINAIKLNPDEPFTWASGWKSPIYCDNRIILSHPSIRREIQSNFVSQIATYFPDANLIAGVATGAIAIGVLIAEKLNLPFVYVRPEPKSHGRKNQIEGSFQAGQKVVVIEDLISTGMSSMLAIDALKNEGIEVLGMMAIFSYEFPIAEQLFDKEKITIKTLSNYTMLLDEAIEQKYISQDQISKLESWKINPGKWGVNS